MPLNGPTQWEDHKIGKKHRKNTQKKTALQKGVCDVVPADDIKGSKKQVRKAGVKPKAAPASTNQQESKVSSELVEAPAGDGALSGDEESGHGASSLTSREAALQKQGHGEWEGDPSQRSDGAVGSQSLSWGGPYATWPGSCDPAWMGHPSEYLHPQYSSAQWYGGPWYGNAHQHQ